MYMDGKNPYGPLSSLLSFFLLTAICLPVVFRGHEAEDSVSAVKKHS